MEDLKERLKQSARQDGAVAVGIASRERLLSSPSSAHPDYLLPDAQSAISFAVAIDQNVLRQSFRKEVWLLHGRELKRATQLAYTMGDHIAGLLRDRGFQAIQVDINNTFRPQQGVSDPLLMTEFLPDFSHRYGAVAAGLGRLGWSGNLLIPRYGATVLLGTVLTTARLEPDPLVADNPCDRCKVCTAVCPVGMMSPRDSVEVSVAGITETIARKQPASRCWVSCGDYHGLEPGGKWTNWSPYRVTTPLPSEKDDIDALLIALRNTDPTEHQAVNPFSEYRTAAFNPDWPFVAACGNCANVCWDRREDRIENRRLITSSGRAVLTPDGNRSSSSGDTVEIDTPFGVRVEVERRDCESGRFAGTGQPATGHTFLDREVLKHLAGEGASYRS